MKRTRILLAFLMAMAMLFSVASGAWASGTGNGVVTPVLWSDGASYSWYSVLAVDTGRAPGQSLAQDYSFTVKANTARLTVKNDGVRELDVAVNGQRLNLNTFFAEGRGTASFDISGLVQYGANTLTVQSLGTPGRTATLTVEAPTFDVRILHVNDMHAKMAPLPKVAAYVKAARAQGGNVFFVDAGDNFSGNPVSDLNKGVPMIQALNAIGTDVFAVGNHDFDNGPAETQARRDESTFPWITANANIVDQSLTPLQPFEPYQVFTNDLGQKIAFIGLTETPPSTGTKNIVGLSFSAPAAAAQRYIAELRDQVNLIVLVSHNGADYDVATLAPVAAGADLIIGAHSHTFFSKPAFANNIPIVQTGSSLANVGDLALHQADTVSITGAAPNGAYTVATKYLTHTDPDVQALVDGWDARMGPILDTKIGYTATSLDSGDKTSQDVSMGNLITDAMRTSMGADIAIWNNGGIRADIPQGDITMRSVYGVLPFGNFIWKAQLTGQQMLDLLRTSFARRNAVDLQISGASYEIFTKPDGSIDSMTVKVNGQPIDPNGTYALAVSDYVATSPSYFSSVPTILDMGPVDALVVAEYIKQVGRLNYPTSEGRIRIKAATIPVPVTKLNFYNSSSLLAAGTDGSLVPLTDQATALVTAEATAYQVDRSGTLPKNFVMLDAGQPIPLVAMQSVGQGKLVASGALLVANGYKAAYQNPQYFTNLLDYLTGSTAGVVLFDQGHGQYYDVNRMSTISTFITDRGYTASFTAKASPLTSSVLAGAKVLVISTPATVGSYTADELIALGEFMAQGGSVMLLSQTDYNNNSNPTELNSIAAGLGSALRFNSDEVRDDTNKDGTANYSPVTTQFNADYPELLKLR
ncbi:MAG: bifunctional metallophosphatase/5'-nucleotidase [Symbiobacteriia bacterium]